MGGDVKPDRIEASATGDARLYWFTWAALLALTMVMLLVEGAAVGRSLLVGVLLAAMLIKVALIAGNFMHLRDAHPGIIWTFIGGLLVTGVLLYVMIVPDALRIHAMVTGR